jgi:1,4-dihydroxy-2-naphthoyl-CoA synthase
MERSDPEKLILVNREPNGIAFVTINRPKALNSLTRAMMRDMAQAFKALDREDSVRVIVLSGSGRAFCSGVDLTAAEDVFKGDVKDPEGDPVAQMERFRKPIIVAVGGFAVTAGFEIALACDIVIAAKRTKFIDTHARFVGLSFFLICGYRVESQTIIGTKFWIEGIYFNPFGSIVVLLSYLTQRYVSVFYFFMSLSCMLLHSL